MKDEFGSFIAETISKMDKSLVMLLLPIAIVIYVCFFMSNEEIESTFGIVNVPKKDYVINCPECNKDYILDYNDDTKEYKLLLPKDSLK